MNQGHAAKCTLMPQVLSKIRMKANQIFEQVGIIILVAMNVSSRDRNYHDRIY